jgi:peptide/nickel transport system substrate-binding protein
LTKIVKEVLTTQSDWPAAVANGEIDGGAPLSYNPDVAEQLRSTDGISSALAGTGATWEHVDLNLKTPALRDLALRKAILTALDVKDLRARLFGDVRPTLRTNPLFPAQSPHHEDVLSSTGYGSGSLDKARELLTRAGYAGTKPGEHLSKSGSRVPALRFAYITGHPTRGTFVEVAQSRLSQIGVTIKPVGVAGSNYLSTLSSGSYDLAILAWDGGPLFTQFPSLFYRTGGGANFVGLKDPALDRAADAMLAETDIEAAAAHANQVAQRVMADAFTLPMWENPSYIFVRSNYVNIRDNPMTSQRAMYNIEAWGVAAGR